jgi:hypothetical protein
MARDMCKADSARLASAPYGPQDKEAFNQFAAIAGVLKHGSIIDGIVVDGTDSEVEGIWKLPNGKHRIMGPSVADTISQINKHVVFESET